LNNNLKEKIIIIKHTTFLLTGVATFYKSKRKERHFSEEEKEKEEEEEEGKHKK
jgi:hypothetical protein